METKIIRIDLDGVNCYLVAVAGGFILFDSGGHLTMDKEFDQRRGRLLAALEQAGCTAGRLKLIVLTHGDSDHSANAAFLRQRFQAPIAMHPADLNLVQNPDMAGWMANFRFQALGLRIISALVGRLIRLKLAKALADFEAFKPDLLIEDGYSLEPYGLAARVLHVPGHTPGSLVILCADGQLISGDSLANGKKPGAAINAQDFSSLRRSLDSLKKHRIAMVFPGHGAPFDFASLD